MRNFSYYIEQFRVNKFLPPRVKRVNLFIDTKGTFQGLFIDDHMATIMRSKSASVVTQEVVDATGYFINLFNKMNIECTVTWFLEHGPSTYHQVLHPEYKAHRKDRPSKFTDEQMLNFFMKIKDAYGVAEQILNCSKNSYMMRFQNLEADVVPYLVRRYVWQTKEENEVDIIISSDKDMSQCLIDNRTFQIRKNKDGYSLFNHLNWFCSVKKDWNLKDAPCDYLPYYLSILGDSSDGINGLDGLGEMFIQNNYIPLAHTVHNMSTLYKNINDSKPIFDETIKTVLFRKMYDNQELMVRNIKLISYYYLANLIATSEDPYFLKYKEQTRRVYRTARCQTFAELEDNCGNYNIDLSQLNCAYQPINYEENHVRMEYEKLNKEE